MLSQRPPRVVRFKSSFWSTNVDMGISPDSYDCDDDLDIYIGGLNENNETVMVKVEGFRPYAYITLPDNIKWNKVKCRKMFNHFQKRLCKNYRPLEFQLLKKYELHHKTPVNVMFLKFKTAKAAKNIYYKAREKQKIDGVGWFEKDELKVSEHDIHPIIKFTAAMKLQLASWIEVTETVSGVPEEEESSEFSKCDIDLSCKWTDVKKYDMKETVISKPKYISFDGEMYSVNHNSTLPQAKINENVIFHITSAIGRENDPLDKVQLYLHTLYDPLDVEEVVLDESNGIKATGDQIQVVRCENEKDLLLKWGKLIEKENPDIFLGYNIMKFDWEYIIHRADMLGCFNKFATYISRIIGMKVKVKPMTWESSAYGKQTFNYMDVHSVNVDVLINIERNYKLPKYSLNAVSEFFLKEQKDDVTPTELFMLYKITQDYYHEVKTNVSADRLREIKEGIAKVMNPRKVHAATKEYRAELMRATPDTIFQLIRKALWITGVYGLRDVVLPIRLMSKLKLWTSMEETSNCTHVPMSYLDTRGQQIKTLAQVYRESFENHIIIPPNDKKDETIYQGATVIDAYPGDYELVSCLDFASLYPSIIIAYNISPDTLLKDGEADDLSESEYHHLKWDEHRYCEHDTALRKTKKSKKDKIICCTHDYRFKRIKMLPDGTRLYEGLFPRLLRNLLTSRKIIKYAMAGLEAKLKMHKGLAIEDDLEEFREHGWEIIKPGSLTKEQVTLLEVEISVLNAQQLAVKVSANSCYGAMGARTGTVPFIKGAASVTGMGRFLIMESIRFIAEKFPTSRLIYGDTDSAMMSFDGAAREEAFDLAKQSSDMTSAHLRCKIMGYNMEDKIHGKYIYKLKKEDLDDLTDDEKMLYYTYQNIPITFEFENMYGRFFLLSKKRYVAYRINRNGKIEGMTKKGIVLVRRDNCTYVRKVYQQMSDGILDRVDKYDIMNSLYDGVHRLFTRQVPTEHLIIYVGVKDILSYIDSVKMVRGGEETKMFKTKDGEFVDEQTLKYMVDANYRDTIMNMKFANYPQANIAVKIISRGDVLPDNTRLEYIYVKTPGTDKVGEHAEDYNHYKENKEFYRLDLLMYLVSKLMKPIAEMYEVKYPAEAVPYEKHNDKLERLVDEFDNDLVVETYHRTRASLKLKYLVTCLKKEYGCETIGRDTELGKHVQLLNSINILDRLYKQHRLPKRKQKKPPQHGRKLLKGTPIMLMKKMSINGRVYDRYERGVVVNFSETLQSTEKNKQFEFKVIMNKDCVRGVETSSLEDKMFIVQRADITSEYKKDGKPLHDIINARKGYDEVVNQLHDIFSPFCYRDK